MHPLSKDLATTLANKNIRPSIQRIKVLEYLMENPCHPTVEQIYKLLQSDIPTLSKTTIYNTLNIFLEAGLVKVLNIENNETRYDIITETHGHFKCEECSTIYNFGINSDSIESEDLIGFKVVNKNVYFKGSCPKCLLNINHNDRKEQIS